MTGLIVASHLQAMYRILKRENPGKVPTLVICFMAETFQIHSPESFSVKRIDLIGRVKCANLLQFLIIITYVVSIFQGIERKNLIFCTQNWNHLTTISPQHLLCCSENLSNSLHGIWPLLCWRFRSHPIRWFAGFCKTSSTSSHVSRIRFCRRRMDDNTSN